MEANPPEEWNGTTRFFSAWVNASNNRECSNIGAFSEPYPLFLGFDWHEPATSSTKNLPSETFGYLCECRRTCCNARDIRQLSTEDMVKLSVLYKKWELAKPLWAVESILKSRDQATYFQSSLTRLFGNRISRKIFGDTPIDPDVATYDHAVILVMDVRKFTSLCENRPPKAIFTMLNPVFKIMKEELEKAGGVILDFSGDCIIVVFNMFDDRPSEIAEIISRTVKSLKRIFLLNAMSLQAEQTDIHIGVGINKGPVGLGYVGGLERCQLTVMGSTINVAARLETASKSLPGDIIVSEFCFDGQEPKVWTEPMKATFTVRDLGPYDEMRNVTHPIRLFGIHPLVKYWVDFVPMGFVARPEKGVVYLVIN